MQSQKIKAFILVELIVVITILAILATIGFMSFQTYTLDARDGNRITTLKEIGNGLEIYQTKNGILPIPDIQTITLLDSSGNTISIQGYIGITIQKTIKLTNEAKDPKDNTYYTYSINGSKTKYQLLTLLENNKIITYNENKKLLTQTYAQTDYNTRYPYIIGNKVGIFFTGITNQPLQETNSGILALSGIATQMKVMFSNSTTNSGTIISTGSNLPAIIAMESNSLAFTGGDILNTEQTYTISSCPTVNLSRNGTVTTKTTILSNINNYIGCKIVGYTGVIGGYTYSGSIASENKMIMIVEDNDTSGTVNNWGVSGTDTSVINTIGTTDLFNLTTEILWNGLANTNSIILSQGIGSTYPAQKCIAKGSGRYLPSTEELNQLYCYSNQAIISHLYYGSGTYNANCINKGYISRNINTLLNFGFASYWSSNESSTTSSWSQDFSTGYRYPYGKTYSFAVRCISRF